MADFSELLKIRRSIRAFNSDPVPMSVVREIIDDSLMAPSSGHGQPWKWIVVADPNLIERLSNESKANILNLIKSDPDSPMKQYEAAMQNKDFNVFWKAPCLVILCGSKSIPSLRVDCALAAAYFMLAASDRGLGTCWVDLGSNIQSPDLLEEIGLPQGCRITAPLALGYPKNTPAPPERKPADIVRIIEA